MNLNPPPRSQASWNLFFRSSGDTDMHGSVPSSNPKATLLFLTCFQISSYEPLTRAWCASSRSWWAAGTEYCGLEGRCERDWMRLIDQRNVPALEYREFSYNWSYFRDDLDTGRALGRKRFSRIPHRRQYRSPVPMRPTLLPVKSTPSG
jgi:hypothetical protein